MIQIQGFAFLSAPFPSQVSMFGMFIASLVYWMRRGVELQSAVWKGTQSMTPPTAKKTTYSFGDFGAINGKLYGDKPQGSKGGKKPASPKAQPKTPTQNNESSRSGIIMLGSLMLTDKERGKALARGGKSAPWHPAVGSAFVRGSYTPKGVKPLRPAAPDDSDVPVRATGSVSRPAGKPASAKPLHTPKIDAGIFPREVPSPVETLSKGLSYGLGKGNYDAGYFTDSADLK